MEPKVQTSRPRRIARPSPSTLTREIGSWVAPCPPTAHLALGQTQAGYKGAPMHDLIVMSDLHLGRGLDPETGRYHLLETFFYDDDFKRFCHYLCTDASTRGTGLRLVLNGDVFDLLRIDPEEPDAASRP